MNKLNLTKCDAVILALTAFAAIGHLIIGNFFNAALAIAIIWFEIKHATK